MQACNHMHNAILSPTKLTENNQLGYTAAIKTLLLPVLSPLNLFFCNFITFKLEKFSFPKKNDLRPNDLWSLNTHKHFPVCSAPHHALMQFWLPGCMYSGGENTWTCWPKSLTVTIKPIINKPWKCWLWPEQSQNTNIEPPHIVITPAIISRHRSKYRKMEGTAGIDDWVDWSGDKWHTV